jgi:hypothetical protein
MPIVTERASRGGRSGPEAAAPALTFSGGEEWQRGRRDHRAARPPGGRASANGARSSRIASRASPTSELRARRKRREPSPVLRRDVAEPERRQAVLDREVEERLLEADDGHHRGEAPEVLEAEDPGGGDRAEDAERDREIEPGCGRETAPEDARCHRGSV